MNHLKYDKLSVIPLGGQSELGQALWVISYAGSLLLVDAGAAYPGEDLPGVDLLLPNTTFLEANQDRIAALLLTNGHEEHSGSVEHLLNHIRIPKIMGPRFVSALVSQILGEPERRAERINIELRRNYEIGPFAAEWIRVNDAIADACALRVGTPEGSILYTSSFKFDPTPVDNQLADIARIAAIGESGVTLLISDSGGSEKPGYTPSEKSVVAGLQKHIAAAASRVFVLLAGTNTHRLQLLLNLSAGLNRKVILYGDELIAAVIAATATENLDYDRRIVAHDTGALSALNGDKIMVIASGTYGDPMEMLADLARGRVPDLTLRSGDTIIYSAGLDLGGSRRMADLLDELLAMGVNVKYGAADQVHVSKHASQEELKLMLNLARPQYFVPALGEARHIAHHAQLAIELGMAAENVCLLRNGDILELSSACARVVGSVESQPVLYNRNQEEKVTNFAVKERKILSTDGIVTIGCVLDRQGGMISGPLIYALASGFLQSPDWEAARQELVGLIVEALRSAPGAQDPELLKTSIKDLAAKHIKRRLQARPVVEVSLRRLPAMPRSASTTA